MGSGGGNSAQRNYFRRAGQGADGLVEWWAALDYGFTHYTVVLLGCRDGDGSVFVVDEHAERLWLPQRHAAAIKAMLGRRRVPNSRWQMANGQPVGRSDGGRNQTINRLGPHERTELAGTSASPPWCWWWRPESRS